MRNAMICVSVMLAIFLAWPLVFGGGNAIQLDASPAQARAQPVEHVTDVQLQPVLAKASVKPATPRRAAPAPLSCYKRYEMAYSACTGAAGGACRMQAADHWDLCEATGFWPE